MLSTREPKHRTIQKAPWYFDGEYMREPEAYIKSLRCSRKGIIVRVERFTKNREGEQNPNRIFREGPRREVEKTMELEALRK